MPPELIVSCLQKGDIFVQAADILVATDQCFLADDRGIGTDKRVEESRASFIAVMALYSTSIVKLKRLEAARL